MSKSALIEKIKTNQKCYSCHKYRLDIRPIPFRLEYFGSLNTWGGRSKTILKSSNRLLEIERANTDATIVFLADCWLDDGNLLHGNMFV